MRIIVDTNIVFSAILNSHGKIGELLLNKPSEVQYFTTGFLLEELRLHSEKIRKLANINKAQYEEIKDYVIQHIEFININEITVNAWSKAAELIGEFDEKDIPFVALAIEIDAFLWTGDKKLTNELNRKKFNQVLATDTLHIKYFG